MDSQNRITIPKELLEGENLTDRKVFIYYDQREMLFFFKFKKEAELFLFESRKLDDKRRFFVPKIIRQIYGTDRLIFTKKEGKIYIIPL